MAASQDLYDTPGDRLDAFVRHSLQPEGDWKDEVKDAQQRIEQFLRDQCFHDELILDKEVRVLKVVKGGSTGKGTTLNYSSDLDLVLFLSCFSSFQDQARLRGDIISFIEQKLIHCSRSLAYNITVAQHREGTSTPRWYGMIQMCAMSSGSHSLCLTQVLPLNSGSFLRGCIISELSLLFSWPGPGSNPPPSVHGVGAITSVLQAPSLYTKWSIPSKPPEIHSDWASLGYLSNPEPRASPCREATFHRDMHNPVDLSARDQSPECDREPIILDPADPTNNLGRKKRWDVVAQEAAYCLRQACCTTVNPLEGWHVQIDIRVHAIRRARNILVTVKQTGKKAWTLSVNPYNPIWKMKTEIKREFGFSGQQRVSFQEPGGDRQLLSSRLTLADYGIFSNVNVRVIETFPPEIQVFVKESSGQSKPYAIDPSDSIRDLKEKIEEAGGPCVENQILKFQGRKLQNRRSLADLQIEDCDTIMLIRRS
uniref:Ubiquitin-like domain-containing protein n=1 Tax=Otolemur garnettii TaxID=30611 RepID=H0XQJ6_OTOGA